MKVIWFRSDLRTIDNPALFSACQSGQPVAALFIATPKQWQQHNWGDNKIAWIAANLITLKKQLNQLNIPLHISCCDDFAALPSHIDALMDELGASELLCNAEPGINESDRDDQVKATLQRKDRQWQRFAEQSLLDFDLILTGKEQPYRVFTPFMRTARRWLSSNPPHPLPAVEPLRQSLPQQLDRWFNKPSHSLDWEAGENAAWAQLTQFMASTITSYQSDRDIPSIKGTSRLSPYLAIGAISAISIYHQLQNILIHGDGETTWLNELIWREFYRYLMHHYPNLSKSQAMYPHKEPEWDTNPIWLERWQKGQTGFPLVDAGMKELLATGWMHNRVRMLCASFLVKDLHLDWRLGEAHFMSLLLDGDFPSNNGGWQWAAGCGADAAPYFRHFSPERQAQRFDSKKIYQRKYLSYLTNEAESSPEPMVDHKSQCQQFSLRIKELSNDV